MRKVFFLQLCVLSFFSCTQKMKKTDNTHHLESLVNAERKFAELSRDKNPREAFLQNLDESSITFNKGEVITHSLDSIQKWQVNESDYLFWWPLVADIAASGDLGYTTGPFEWGKREAGNLEITGGGYYASVWQKNKNGQWKVAADLGAGVLDPLDKSRHWIKEEKIHILSSESMDIEKEREHILHYDKTYNDRLNAERKSFTTDYLSPNGRLHRSGEKPFDTPEKIQANIDIEKNVSFSFEQSGGGIAKSADMAYTYGQTTLVVNTDEKEQKILTNYLRVWKKENQQWKIVLDVIQ